VEHKLARDELLITTKDNFLGAYCGTVVCYITEMDLVGVGWIVILFVTILHIEFNWLGKGGMTGCIQGILSPCDMVGKIL
jgi:hypothetical protein